MSSLPPLIALPSLNESSPLAHLMTPEVLRRLGLTTHRSATVAQVSDSGNPHEINIPLSVQASAIKYSVLQDGMSDSLPNAIVVSSWEIALLSPQCQSVTYQILRAIRDSGVPVYLVNSSPHFTLDPLKNLSETLFTGVQITQIPAYETSLVESKSGELLGLPRDSIKVLDVVELRRLFLRWRTLRDQIPDIQNTPHTYISDTWAPSVADRIDSTSPLLNGSPAHLATIITQVSEIELTPAQHITFLPVLHLNPMLSIALKFDAIGDIDPFFQTHPAETRIRRIKFSGYSDSVSQIDELSQKHPEVNTFDGIVSVTYKDWDSPIIQKLTTIDISKPMTVERLRTILRLVPQLRHLYLRYCQYDDFAVEDPPLSHPTLSHIHFIGLLRSMYCAPWTPFWKRNRNTVHPRFEYDISRYRAPGNELDPIIFDRSRLWGDMRVKHESKSLERLILNRNYVWGEYSRRNSAYSSRSGSSTDAPFTPPRRIQDVTGSAQILCT
ncbi:hypothetical protein EBR57_00930 [bacterium]|nr:hypothetical protein [bacterium]